MRVVNRFSSLALVAALVLGATAMAFAQETDTTSNKTRPRTTSAKPAATPPEQAKERKPAALPTGERLEPDDPARTPSDVPPDMQANRQEQISEEVDVVPYYNNFFNTYRLGPEDVISVSVFGQDRYSRTGIVIPPSGRISLALVQGGLFVNGKTVDEVAEMITKHYDEYIIDPQVTVSLEKGFSYRYAVIGDVAQPGIRLMNRRLTVSEAITEAGGVLPTGNRSKVVVLRRQPTGVLSPIAVNLSAIYKGKAPDNTYLVPGDQILVPGNKWKTFQKIMSLTPVLSFARIFTGGGLPF